MKEFFFPFSTQYVISQKQMTRLQAYAKKVWPFLLIAFVVNSAGLIVSLFSMLYSMFPFVEDSESRWGVWQAIFFVICFGLNALALSWQNRLQPLGEESASQFFDLCRSYNACDRYRLQVLAKREVLLGDLTVVHALRDQEIYENTRRHKEETLKNIQNSLYSKMPLCSRASTQKSTDAAC